MDPHAALPVCVRSTCGNGHMDLDEECDDGNNTGGDGCSPNCRVERCGDGILAQGEQCDDGNTMGGDGCSARCTIEICGNGILDRAAGEQCDDGNTIDGDGCSASCTLPSCSNGIVDPYEQCDDGNTIDGDGCSTRCTIEICGNGILDRAHGEQCDDGNATDGDGCEANCMLPSCRNGVLDYGEQCDDGNLVTVDGCSNDCTASVLAYIKASYTSAWSRFGTSIALSKDGLTLAVSAPGESGGGAVYMFARSGKTWHEQTRLGPYSDDQFGASVALSADGSILAVGAPGAPGGGAVYVFLRQSEMWARWQSIFGYNINLGAQFGASVALSADGLTLAVGTPGESSAVIGIDGEPGDNAALGAGAVYVFAISYTWYQQAYIKASNTGAQDQFGASIALSADGSTLAVGAPGESSAAIGIDGNQIDNTASGAGAVYLFTRSGAWSQQAYVKASNTDAQDQFGASVALSADGSTLAVGAPGESSMATGIDGNQADNSISGAGAVYLFTHSGAAWRQQAYIKASNTKASYAGAGLHDNFGTGVALSADGAILVVGAPGESSAAIGIDSNQNDTSAPGAGAGYLFTHSGVTWRQQVYIKASNTRSLYNFGYNVAMSANGATLAVGSPRESSTTTGIDGNQTDNSAPDAGAVYMFY